MSAWLWRPTIQLEGDHESYKLVIPGVEAGDASCDEAETGGISGITSRASLERIRCRRFLSWGLKFYLIGQIWGVS